MYNSGADGHYISENDREAAHLPILRQYIKCVIVTNGEKSNGQNVTSLPFPLLSSKAQQADTFKEFPTSIMSVRKNSQWWQDINFHQRRGRSSRQHSCPNHMQKQTTLHWSKWQTRALPHSTSATSWTMAATTPFKESMPCNQPGKQRLWPPIHRTSNKMDALCLCIPIQVHMDTRHQSGQLCGMVNAHRIKQ